MKNIPNNQEHIEAWFLKSMGESFKGKGYVVTEDIDGRGRYGITFTPPNYIPPESQ